MIDELKSTGLGKLGSSASLASSNNKSLLLDSFKALKDASIYVASKTMQQTQAVSNINDGTNKGKLISNQILVEPLKAVDPDNITNATIGQAVTNTQAFLSNIEERLSKTSELSSNPSSVDNKQIKECVYSSAKKCTTVVKSEALSSELSTGSKLESIYGKYTVAAHSVGVHTDNVFNVRSPAIFNNAQDINIQANNSWSLISDVKLEELKHDVSFIEGTKISQSQDSIHIATNTNDLVSKNTKIVGTENTSLLGGETTIAADNNLNNISGGNTFIAAYQGMGVQAGGDIFITASGVTNTDTTVFALGDITNTNPSIIIGNDTDRAKNVLAFNSEGNIYSTTGNSLFSSEGYVINASKQGSYTISDSFVYSGNRNSGVLIKGNRMFLNSSPIPLGDIPIPKIIDFPPLPTFPTFNSSSLDKCIPDKYKKGVYKATGELFPDAQLSQSTSGNDEGDIIVETIPGEETIGNNNIGVVTNNTIPTLKPNLIDLPTNIQNQKNTPVYKGDTGSNIGNPGLLNNQSNKKLPPNTNTSVNTLPTESASFKGLSALAEAGTGIYIDRFNNDVDTGIFQIATGNLFTEDNRQYFGLEDDDLSDFSVSVLSHTNTLTSDIVRDRLSNLLPTGVLDRYTNPAIYLSALFLPTEKRDLNNITINDFVNPNNTDAVKALLELISLYPQTKPIVVEIIKIATALPAIGLFSIGTKLITSIGAYAKDINGLVSLPQVIKSKDFNRVKNTISPILTKVLGKDNLLTKVADDSIVNKIGTDLLKGRDVETIISEVINSEIEKQIISNIPTDYSDIVPSIKELLLGVQKGKTIDQDIIIRDLVNLLKRNNKDASKAIDIYRSLQGLINDIGSSKLSDLELVKSLLGNSNLDSLLGVVLGSDNKGQIKAVFDFVKESIGTIEALTLLPELLTIMDNYKIPGLEQINVALSCLDLFNRIKSLMDRFQAIGKANSNKKAMSLLEYTPRMIQAVNSSKEVSNDLVNEDIDLSKDVTIPVPLDQCFKVPKLTLYEAEVVVLSLSKGVIEFSIVNIQELSYKYQTFIRRGDRIQIRVSSFTRTKDNSVLLPYQTEFQYTPFIHTFIIDSFDFENNIGLAIYEVTSGSLILEDTQGLLYEYVPQALGVHITVNIEEAYLLI